MPGLLSWIRCTATFPVSGRCPGQDGRGPAGPGRSVPGAPQPREPRTCPPQRRLDLESQPRGRAPQAFQPPPRSCSRLGHTNCPAGGADPCRWAGLQARARAALRHLLQEASRTEPSPGPPGATAACGCEPRSPSPSRVPGPSAWGRLAGVGLDPDPCRHPAGWVSAQR